MHRSLEGIQSALVTPFGEDGSVDEDALVALVRDQLDHGIGGLVVGGSTGEFPALTAAERRRCAELVVETAAGTVPVTIGLGAMTTREAVEHAEHARAIGADIGMLVSPYYEPMSEREIEAHARAVAVVGLPIMLYNNPGGTGTSMRPELIARLARVDGIEYLKDTTFDGQRLFEIAELVGDDVELLSGQDTLTLLSFLGGRRAAVWGAANATPAACVRLWELAVRDGMLEAARTLWRELYPVNRFFEREGYVQSVRAAAELRGVTVGPPRRPMLPLAPDAVERLRVLLDRVNVALGALAT